MGTPGRKPTIRTPEEVIAYVEERNRQARERYHRKKVGGTDSQQAAKAQLKSLRTRSHNGTLYSILYEIAGVVPPEDLDRIPKEHREDHQKRGINIVRRYQHARKKMAGKIDRATEEQRIHPNERNRLYVYWFEVSKPACIRLLSTTDRKLKAQQRELDKRYAEDKKLCEKYDKEDTAKAEKKQKNRELGYKKAKKTLDKTLAKKKKAMLDAAVQRCIELRKSKKENDEGNSDN